ncbi:MAG: hypothetical protein ACK4UO_09490 [Pseudolabrys sp.]
MAREPRHRRGAGSPQPGERDVKTTDSYATQLGGLLPAEITGVYIAVRGLFEGVEPPEDRFVFLLAGVLGVLSYFILPQLVKINLVSQRLLYIASFFVWVVAIEITRVTALFGEGLKPVIIGLCLIWTFAVPYLFKSLAQK